MRAAPDQKSLAFSGVFAIIWIGEAVVTVQIKLLGGNMQVLQSVLSRTRSPNMSQILLPVGLHHRIYLVSSSDRFHTKCSSLARHCTNPRLHLPGFMVACSRNQHPGWIRRPQKPVRHRRVSAVCLLHRPRMLVSHQLEAGASP